MIDQSVEAKIKGLEDLTGQSADYLRDIYRASPAAYAAYEAFQNGMGQYQASAPSDALAVAAIAVMREQDCGPCMQISVTFAELDGVDSAVLQAAFQRKLDALPTPLDTVYLYAEAVAKSDWNSAEYEPVVRAAYGDAAMVDFAFRIASSAVYPTLKRALGHGHACSSIKIGGTLVTLTTPDRHDDSVTALA